MNFDQADALNEAIRAIGIRHRELAVSALAPYGIHPGHKLLLLELETAGPSTLAQLADASGYEPPTITVSVRQLESAGYVARRPSPTDGRAVLIDLSAKGRALLPNLKAAWRRVAEQTVAGLRPAEIDLAAKVLAGVAASLASRDLPAKDVPRYVPKAPTPRAARRTRRSESRGQGSRHGA